MFNKITTITAISTLVACSTPFDAADLDQDAKIPSADSVQSGEITEMNLSIDEQAGLAYADVDVPTLDIVEDQDPSVSTPVIVEAQERLNNFVPQTPENTYDMAALLTKRVDNELQVRLYPGAKVSAKVCLHRTGGDDCFKGEVRRFDNDQGGELAIELDRYESARTFSIMIAEPGVEYAAMGPFEMPAADNTWTEQQSCESRALIENVEYSVHDYGEEKIAYVSYQSIDPTSTQICGVDEAGDSVCVWEPVSTGAKNVKVRVEQAASVAYIRDESGCSLAIEPTN